MEDQTQTKQEIVQVTTKNPKKVETGKRLAEWNRKRREEKINNKRGESKESNIDSFALFGISSFIVIVGYFCIRGTEIVKKKK